jgi:hypothetical protein
VRLANSSDVSLGESNTLASHNKFVTKTDVYGVPVRCFLVMQKFLMPAVTLLLSIFFCIKPFQCFMPLQSSHRD